MNVETILRNYINRLGDTIDLLLDQIDTELDYKPINETRIEQLKNILYRLNYRLHDLSTKVLNARGCGGELECIQLLNSILTHHLPMCDNMILMAITNDGLWMD